MKIQDVFSGTKDEISIKVKVVLLNEFLKKTCNAEVNITYSNETYWLVYDDGERFEITGVSVKDNSELDSICVNNSLVLLVETRGNKAEIKARLFTNKISIPSKIEIGFPDIILDDIDKRFSRQKGKNRHEDWLRKELCISSDNKESVYILVNEFNSDKGFRIFGKSICIDLSLNSDNQLEISRILEKTAKMKPAALISTEIEIKDISTTGQIRADISNVLSKVSSTQKYINTWELYAKKEQEYAEVEAKKLGVLSINKITKKDSKRFRVYLNKEEKSTKWPQSIKGEFIDIKREALFSTFDSYKKDRSVYVCKLINIYNDFFDIEYDKDNFPIGEISMFCCLSLLGNKIMYSRRERALEAISDNTVPMPQLAAVLENIEIPSVERRKIKALTVKTKNIFGVFGPNDMQENALDVALNTPDIAIIQGPPGTGKTKVISALASRLTEECKNNGSVPEMNILLTAFQHDAVENMASRTEVMNLPSINIGKHNSIDIIDRWIKNQTEKLDSSQVGVEPNDLEFIYNDVVKSYFNYIESLDQEKAKNDLLIIRKENLSILSDEVIDRIAKITKKESDIDDNIVSKISSLIRDIRCDKISFSDDGDMNLRRFIKNYNRYIDNIPELDSEIISYVELLQNKENISESEFHKLSEYKVELLDQLTIKDVKSQINLPNVEIERLYKYIIDELANTIKSEGSIYTLLSEFKNDLNSNKEHVRKTINDYVSIVASTVQASQSKIMKDMKENPFETVIVDEAARANPLDLIIPLTSAKRRIVLVGDHRQLPHIVDNKIQRDLENNIEISDDLSKHLNDSLFERFYTMLKSLKEKDGIERVVTLNTQYRMHPVIGDFISKTFYERYGDSKITSGTPAEKLNHNIKEYQSKVAVSVNIPNNKGKEEKQAGSTYRTVEAKEIVRRAKDILDIDSSLSVGIITFYGRQVTEIQKEAECAGLTEKDDDGTYFISKKYSRTSEGDERFRIGSVDSFQGKEFDVVLLSLVRSNNIKINSPKDVRKKYGFLTSYNRLNVAMSRAKMLIISVGDEAMFSTAAAKDSVFGLYEFYNELIKSDYGCSV